MNYTPGDIFRAMGRKWWCDDDYTYSLDPNLCYSVQSIMIMQREWEWRLQCHAVCVESCTLFGLRVPKKKAQLMPRGTPQQLEAALFRVREEEN